MDLTPVQQFGKWWAKRDDLANVTGPDFPSGSKVRQYARMAAAAPGRPMIVGCSAHSAMQIYVAAAAQQTGVPGIIYTAKRRDRSAATEYAIAVGAEVNEIAPGYLSVCRARARARAKELGPCVRWDVPAAIKDAADQCANLPDDVERVVVPTGSGLTCIGILIGMAARWGQGELGHARSVLIVAVSDMADRNAIVDNARRNAVGAIVPHADLLRVPSRYEDWTAARLPDGSALDPYYAAKALPYVQPGDCLWIPGARPLSAMPAACRAVYERLHGSE